MRFILLLLSCMALTLHAQYPNASTLTLEQIMEGEDFIGHSPTNPFWSMHQDSLYFYWQKQGDERQELYAYVLKEDKNVKVALASKPHILERPSASSLLYDGNYVIEDQGGALLLDKQYQRLRYLILLDTRISQVQIQPDKKGFYFLMDQVYYHYDYLTGSVTSLYKLQKGKKLQDKKENSYTWLKKEEVKLFDFIREQNSQQEVLDSLRKMEQEAASPLKPEFFLDDKTANASVISANGATAYYIVSKREPTVNTEVPNFIGTDGYVKMMSARAKVGINQPGQELLMLAIDKDTSMTIDFSALPGIKDKPLFMAEYHKDTIPYETKYKTAKPFGFGRLISAPDGSFVIADLYSRDNKDRWIVKISVSSGAVEMIDHQHDEGWIGGPGVRGGSSLGFLKDGSALYFKSEQDGYAHLYLYNITTKKTTQLTKGNFEIHDFKLSNDGKFFLLQANKIHPGVFSLYKVEISSGKWTSVAEEEGRHDAVWSPAEDWIASVFSTANTPPELFVRKADSKGPWKQITKSTTSEFNDYKWRKPDFKTFKAADGATVHARVYKPSGNLNTKGAVIFVHGAGYLQNAHKHWSTYSREYMFHHFLTDNGYTVLDLDYRGSAGYGRDWRTGIYRHMGGLDLSDHVDAIPILVSEYGVDPDKIGMYGGSYGGFITLMALFQHPGTFACGAALRSVTDWAHYNHAYTANILNTPEVDSLSYLRSSPIYFAENLADPLLILHGMVDNNVQFQDVVRLSQRLIELGKDNWEMAVFPVESHGFERASSWVDEYKRIYRLFDQEIGGN